MPANMYIVNKANFLNPKVNPLISSSFYHLK